MDEDKRKGKTTQVALLSSSSAKPCPGHQAPNTKHDVTTANRCHVDQATSTAVELVAAVTRTQRTLELCPEWYPSKDSAAAAAAATSKSTQVFMLRHN